MSNPFKPTAGRIPPVLVGRKNIIADFEYALEDGPGAPGRLMFLTGARGVGKTVMLDVLGDKAKNLGWTVINETAESGFTDRLMEQLRSIGKDTDVVSYDMPKTSVEAGGYKASLDLGKINFDNRQRQTLSLRRAFTKQLDMVEKQGKGLLVTLDEVQSSSLDEMRSLSVAMQHLIREHRNIAFLFAGLPNAVGEVLDDKVITFLQRAEREHLGAVDNGDVLKSFDEIFGTGKHASMDVLIELTKATHGYPFMIQLVGYWAWRCSDQNGHSDRVSIDYAEEGIDMSKTKLGDMVHAQALKGLPAQAINYLLAMSLDDDVSRTGDVARRMERSPQFANIYRMRLVDEDIIEPAGRGFVRFKLPYLRDYLREHAAFLQMRGNVEEL